MEILRFLKEKKIIDKIFVVRTQKPVDKTHSQKTLYETNRTILMSLSFVVFVMIHEKPLKNSTGIFIFGSVTI